MSFALGVWSWVRVREDRTFVSTKNISLGGLVRQPCFFAKIIILVDRNILTFLDGNIYFDGWNVWWGAVYWFRNETKTNSQTSQTSQNSLFKFPLPSLPSAPLIRNSNLHYIRHTTVDITSLQTETWKYFYYSPDQKYFFFLQIKYMQHLRVRAEVCKISN